MTYKEYYLSLKSVEDIINAATIDKYHANFINNDRIYIIDQAMEEAIEEKFGGVKKVKQTVTPIRIVGLN